MGNVIAVVNGLPPAIKAGWVLWMAWAVAQVVWYRRAHGGATRAAQPAAVAPVARRRPDTRLDSRADARSESRADARAESRAHAPAGASADTAPSDAAASVAAALPVVDLSDIRAAAEGPSRSSDSAPPRGSILGLDPRPSTN